MDVLYYSFDEGWIQSIAKNIVTQKNSEICSWLQWDSNSRFRNGPRLLTLDHPTISNSNIVLSSYIKYTVFNATWNFLFILILPRHVSAALGHHQVLLLKLSHCNFYIICSFLCAYLFICLMPRLTLFPFSTSPFLIFTILKILKIMCLL
jgi:hypothetical protein